MDRYHIVGRAGAGSLIAEFLFREVGVDYDISFPDVADVKSADFHASNPLAVSYTHLTLPTILLV